MSKALRNLGPHGITLLVAWVLTTGTFLLMLAHGVRYTEDLSAVRYLLQAGYVAALLWYLGSTGPRLDQLPELGARVFSRWTWGAWVPVIIIALLFMLTMMSDDGFDIVMLLLILATASILLAWRKEIRLNPVVQAVVIALFAYLAGVPAVENGLIGKTTHLLLAGFSAPMYVAGGLLIDRTRLGGIQLRSARYKQALRSWSLGCLLFVPLGLINAAEGSPGTGITWVTEWWIPISLPWFSGIAEETWFRLMLVGLSFYFLRPAYRRERAVAVVAAVLFSAIISGLGHGRTLERFLTTGLLYGVPFAAVFARRDWEHAVGAHYMVNLIPWFMVYLET